MKQLLRPAAIVIAALITLGSLAACSSTNGAPSGQPAATSSAATVLPVTSNPMTTTGTKPGLTITGAIAENNVDPKTKAPIPDRLQFTLTNTTPTPMTGLQVYYTMKDTTAGKSESYYQKLDGLTLAAGQSETIYFDNGTGPGHYPENKYSLYRNSTNKVTITIEAGAAGYATATGTAVKSPGTGEKLD
ncbi:MAG: hypothetical protein M3021_10150 [Actinomycetota bacterium]|nr:hypothetical protein [Actinomycetota bacterium]